MNLPNFKTGVNIFKQMRDLQSCYNPMSGKGLKNREIKQERLGKQGVLDFYEGNTEIGTGIEKYGLCKGLFIKVEGDYVVYLLTVLILGCMNHSYCLLEFFVQFVRWLLPCHWQLTH